MEVNNQDFELDDEDDEIDSKKKKSKSLADFLLKKEKKTTSNQENNDKKNKDKPESLVEPDNETLTKKEIINEDILSEKEETEIIQDLADEHLKELITEENESLAVQTFLERLSLTGDIEESYNFTTELSTEDYVVEEPDISKIEDNIKKTNNEPNILNVEQEIIINRYINSDNVEDIFKANSQLEKKEKETKTSSLKNTSEGTSFYDILVDNLFNKRKTVRKDNLSEINKRKIKEEISNLDKKIITKTSELEKIRISPLDNSKDSLFNRVNMTNQYENIVEKSLDLKPSLEKTLLKSEKLKPEIKNTKMVSLTDKEIISLSEKIKIEGVSLKTFYQNKEVSFNGLKRILNEYLKTGSIEKILKKELIEHQIDFEKDPILKDVRNDDFYTESSSPKSINELLAKKGLDIVSKQGQNIVLSTPPVINKKIKKEKSFESPIVNIFLSIIIVFLIGLIIYLLISKL